MDEPKEIGDWLLICILGAGAFGKVTLWRNKETQQHIAVKKCKIQMQGNLSARQRERWMNEVDIMKSIKNENIVGYKQLPKILEEELLKYNPTALPILPMEYCNKGNLRTFLLQPQNIKGCEEYEVRCILQDISNAVSYLHGRNISHRDIKPENIVIQEYNARSNSSIYKLIDLGYAKELETIASFVGTLPYLAPEIFHNLPYTNSIDYWSLGILTYEIITGEHPFLKSKSPVERFNYVKEKSDEDITISVSKDGIVKYSKEIIADNHLSSIFKRDMENWLKLLLRYDSKKRGILNNETKDIFNELDVLLKKKTITVFSVFNYCPMYYELRENMNLFDIKSLIERDLSIPRNQQVFVSVAFNSIISDDNSKILGLYENSNELALYVFKKGSTVDVRTVTIPNHVQALFQPIKTNLVAVLKVLYSHALFFISQERKLLKQFQTAVLLQIEHTTWFFETMKILHYEARCNLVKLITQIECCNDLTCIVKQHLAENEEYIKYLEETRKDLRQTKELIENFNALTASFLKIQKLEWVCKQSESLRKALLSTEEDMDNTYSNAKQVFQKITSSNSYSTDMTKILSNVLKIPRVVIFSNEDLQKYIRTSVFAQRNLQKLFVWCKAIDHEVKRVSSSFLNCEKIKYEYAQSMYSRTKSITVTTPKDYDDDVEELNSLVKANLSLRYRIQEISDEGSEYIRQLQAETIYFWNGIVSNTKLK